MPEYCTPGQDPNCNSNVLFLPGIMGSRLLEGDEKRWEPDGEADVQAMYLTPQGRSESPSVHATEVLDEVPVTGGNIYESFLGDLATASTTGTIASYAAVPYDWRLSLEDILADGSIETKLRALAATSRTGKVTIVAHSNGGLLAKALINELGTDASGLIDQLILVAVPQTGTPQAIGSLLHGFDTGLPFDWFPLILSPERARDFARNAPFAYNLLPLQGYSHSEGVDIYSPLISFEGGTATQTFRDKYGGFVNYDELNIFLTDANRSAPAYDDLENPAVVNYLLLERAKATGEAVGYLWTPPQGITVHQIAGIGEDTLAGITYKTVTKCVQSVTLAYGKPLCLAYEDALSYVPNTVADGDGTVVVPSALAMSTSNPSVRRWWVDLKQNNDHNFRFWIFRLNHADILEVTELRSFIFDALLTHSTTTLPEYVSDSPPLIPSEKILRFTLHSPLTLSVTGSDGTDYPAKRYGAVQVVSVPAVTAPTVHLTGEQTGSFTLDVEEYVGDLVVTTTFSGIPSSSSTVASMSFPDGSIATASDFTIDYDGDGTIDVKMAPRQGEMVSLPAPSVSELIALLKERIQSLIITDHLKTTLQNRVTNLEKQIEKKREKNANMLAKLDQRIANLATKHRISSVVAGELRSLVDLLEVNAEYVLPEPEVLATLRDKVSGAALKQGIKNDMLKRITRLEQHRALSAALMRLTSGILKKGENGKIPEQDVREMLQLLQGIDEMI